MSCALQDTLHALVEDTPWLMRALHAVRDQNLMSWCIGAGTLRNLVWDTAHGYPTAAHKDCDIDVVYFDPHLLGRQQDATLQATLENAIPDLVWEVTNQAAVHLWYEAQFGYAIAPMHSLEQAIGTWPETATAVGVYLDETGCVRSVAPHGLDDLFGLVVRRNPATCASVATCRERMLHKRFCTRWPNVRVIPV